MLFASAGTQHGASYHQQNRLRPGRNSVQFQHRRCAMVLPRYPPPVQVLAANDTTTAGASSSSSSSSLPFHDREMERKALKDHCSSQPTAISVILGPPSTGKTALLEDYMRDRDLNDSRCYINARVTPISTPNSLAQELLESAVFRLARMLFPDLRRYWNLGELLTTATSDAVQDKLKLPNGMEITGNAAQILKALAGNQAPALSEVTATYAALLSAWYEASASGKLSDASPPVLVIDDANKLMNWGDQYKTERQDLLSFFVAISKEQCYSHVVLVTSEYPFVNWLDREIGACFYTTFVIGDLRANDAREFLNKCLQRDGKPVVSNTDWKEVHKVCGGNAGALKGAARFYQTLGSWEKALTQLTKDVWFSMKPGRLPGLDAGYTAADYATAVKDILDSDHNAVEDVGLAAKLGKQSLDAMVQANLLALRPYSCWATDIDVEAFGPGQSYTVVTAPTALHLYLMKRERDTLLKPLY